jgi:hypothetical protein
LDLVGLLQQPARRLSVGDRDLVRRGNSRALQLDFHDDFQEGQSEVSSIHRVEQELAKYEHPFFDFSAREKGDAVELIIQSKVPDVLSPEYRITLNERDVQSSQFQWTFQKLLYDCLTDYVVELFTKNP